MSALPRYRYVAGRTPHPRRDPRGHSFGQPEPEVADAADARRGEDALLERGVELFTAGYFWERHEAFEALWRAAGRHSPEGRLLQALVWLAAAEWKRLAGPGPGSARLARRALARLRSEPPALERLDRGARVASAAQRFERGGAEPVRIRLSR